MTREALVSKKEAGDLFALLAVLLVIGSIFDFQISQALYNESNPIANFFAAYGEYPAMLGFAASGALLVIGRNRRAGWLERCSCWAACSWLPGAD